MSKKFILQSCTSPHNRRPNLRRSTVSGLLGQVIAPFPERIFHAMEVRRNETAFENNAFTSPCPSRVNAHRTGRPRCETATRERSSGTKVRAGYCRENRRVGRRQVCARGFRRYGLSTRPPNHRQEVYWEDRQGFRYDRRKQQCDPCDGHHASGGKVNLTISRQATSSPERVLPARWAASMASLCRIA